MNIQKHCSQQGGFEIGMVIKHTLCITVEFVLMQHIQGVPCFILNLKYLAQDFNVLFSIRAVIEKLKDD